MGFWNRIFGNKKMVSVAPLTPQQSSSPHKTHGAHAKSDEDAIRDKALHSAAFKGDTQAGEALLAEGADVNAKDDRGHTPLYSAAWQGQKEMVAFLIEHGAEVDSHPDGGETPLSMAVGNNHKEVVELLLTKGADVNAADDLGHTPLYRAIEHDYISVATVLIQHGAAVDGISGHDRPLDEAIRKGDRDSVQLLVENGADVNAIGAFGIAPLISAIFGQDAKLIDILLRYGADVNTKTQKGESALAFAIRHGCADVAALLMKPPARASRAETPTQAAKPACAAAPLNAGTDGDERRISFPKHYEEHLHGWKTLRPKVEAALQNNPMQNQESAKTSLVNAIALDIQAHSEISVQRIAYLQMSTMLPTFKKMCEGVVSNFHLFSSERSEHLANSYYWFSRLLREYPNTRLLATAHGDMGILSFMDLMHSMWRVKYDQSVGTEHQTNGIFWYYHNFSVRQRRKINRRRSFAPRKNPRCSRIVRPHRR